MKLKIAKETTNEINLPTKKRVGDGCFDIYSNVDKVLNPGERSLVSTGISMQLPKGTFGKLYTRSGMALQGIDVLGGVIDENYRGEVGVILHNSSDKYYFIKKGDRIAQLGIHKVEQVEVEFVDFLDSTERGNQGFGSSGK